MKTVNQDNPKSDLRSIVEGIIFLMVPLLIGYLIYLLA